MATVPSGGFYGWETVEAVPFQRVPRSRRELHLSMCAKPAAKLRLVVQIVTRVGVTNSNIGISFNQSWPNFDPTLSRKLLFPAGSFTEHSAQNTALNFSFETELVHEGWNRVTVMNCGSEAFEVLALELGLIAR